MCEVWHVQIWNEKKKCVWWINYCIKVLCVPCLMSSVHEMDCWRRTYSLCWAFFTIDSMWLSHFRSWEIVVPSNLNDSTAVAVLFMMVSGGRAGGFSCLLKSTIISIIISFRLLRLHQTASSLKPPVCKQTRHGPEWGWSVWYRMKTSGAWRRGL